LGVAIQCKTYNGLFLKPLIPNVEWFPESQEN